MQTTRRSGYLAIRPKGGDSDGKALPCERNPDPDVPLLFKLHTPYPNPASHGFVIGFSIPCQMDAQMWAVLPSGQGLLGESVLSQGIFVRHHQDVIWRLDQQTFTPGSHQLLVSAPDIRGGFIRVYFKADGILAWRDAGLFNDPCLIPGGFTIDGMTRSDCGK